MRTMIPMSCSADLTMLRRNTGTPSKWLLPALGYSCCMSATISNAALAKLVACRTPEVCVNHPQSIQTVALALTLTARVVIQVLTTMRMMVEGCPPVESIDRKGAANAGGSPSSSVV